MNDYYVSLCPGLSDIVIEEIRVSIGLDAGNLKRLRNSELLFLRTDKPERLLELRTVEDVFMQLGVITLTGRPEDLKVLAKSPLFSSLLSRGIKLWAAVAGKPGLTRSLFRIVVQADDVHWREYRRVDLQNTAEGVVLRTHPSWRLNRYEAPVEIWLQQIGRELVVGLRLTTTSDRQHGGRSVERGAALKPSVAAAMVLLSQPSSTDVFLDPMCGTGTILMERAVMERYEMLMGGDIDKGAISATLANFGPRHKPRRIEHWDATLLPIEDGAVNKIACNLPWGRQVGEKAGLPVLYEGIVREAARVLTPGGRMVLLTSEWNLLKHAIKQRSELKLERTVQGVEILGRRADIFVLIKLYQGLKMGQPPSL